MAAGIFDTWYSGLIDRGGSANVSLGRVTTPFVSGFSRIVVCCRESREFALIKAVFGKVSGDTITNQQIRLERWPVEIIPEGAFTDRMPILGKRTISKITIGTPIMPEDVE